MRTHDFSRPCLGSRTSPYLQEKLSILGSEHVFGAVPQIVESLLGIQVNETQVYRTAQAVSEAIPEGELHSPSQELAAIENDPRQRVYGMVDGSMLQMEDGWQETKVGRVFQADTKEKEIDYSLHWDIQASEYVAHRGHYSGFTEKFERLLPPESPCKKVFVTDGALWIGHWLSGSYPGSVQILDFFHVCEKLSSAAKSAGAGEGWLEQQKYLLLAGKQAQVCKAVARLEHYGPQEREQLLNYLRNNAYRMHYHQYRRKGMMISSGPIESAHRTVLQVRMKRSGQHWSPPGCDHMIKLRVACRSKKLPLITNVFKKQAA